MLPPADTLAQLSAAMDAVLLQFDLWSIEKHASFICQIRVKKISLLAGGND